MNKKIIIITLVVLAVVIIGVLKLKSTKDRDKNMPLAKQYAIIVSSIKPKFEQNRLTLPYIAETKNDKEVVIISKNKLVELFYDGILGEL